MEHRNRYTLAQWRELLKQQKESGLTIIQFCKANQLNCSTYYNYKNRLERVPSDAFSKVNIVKESTKKIALMPPLILKLPIGELQLPSELPAIYLAQLIKGLAS